jgi:hypothetical protein
MIIWLGGIDHQFYVKVKNLLYCNACYPKKKFMLHIVTRLKIFNENFFFLAYFF